MNKRAQNYIAKAVTAERAWLKSMAARHGTQINTESKASIDARKGLTAWLTQQPTRVWGIPDAEDSDVRNAMAALVPLARELLQGVALPLKPRRSLHAPVWERRS